MNKRFAWMMSARLLLVLGVAAQLGAGQPFAALGGIARVQQTQSTPLPPTRTSQTTSEGETLLFMPPKGFQQGYHSERNESLTEFVPEGQTVENWTEMVTVQIFRGLRADPAPFLQSIGRGIAAKCPQFSSPKGIVSGQENGYPVSMLVVQCPLNPATGKPETTLFRVIKGKAALYSVQYAWRSVASEKEVKDAVVASRNVGVCDTADTDHPCPPLSRVAPAPR